MTPATASHPIAILVAKRDPDRLPARNAPAAGEITFSSVLLVDDDEDDLRLTRALLDEAGADSVSIDWAPNYRRGLSSLLEGSHDVALIDYRLGSFNGIDLLRAVRARGRTTPLIMLTGDADGRVDRAAMGAGADDYLVKGRLTAPMLERSIRYAVRRRRIADLLKHRQDKAQAKRELLAAIVESSEDAILGITPDGLVLSWNSGAERLYGYTAAEMIGQPLDRLVPPEQRAEIPGTLARLRRGEHLSPYETVRVAKDGRHIDVSLTISPIFDAAGAVMGQSSVARDISGRKRAEAELGRTTEHLRVLLSRAPIALWTLDAAGMVMLAEGQLLQQMGFKPGELVGQSVFEMYRDCPEICELTRQALRGEPVNATQKRGGVVFDTWYSPMRHLDGELVGTIGIALDVSERHRFEEQFRQAQKMEAVGRLAGGVAHDFNNLLTAILGFAEMTIARLPPDDPMCEDVQQILNAGQSAASLTRQLLAFSRKQILEPQILDVNALVGDMQTLLRRVIGEDVLLVTALGDRMRSIHSDRGQLEQVIMNLAVNARDAMPSGGTLSIVTETVEPDETFIAAHPGAAKGLHVRLTLKDTGTGMGPDVLAHLFEPFFTTKEKGKGTGLGLATVYGIVKQSGGYIWVESRLGEGTSFMINFPGVATEPGSVVATENGPRAVSGTETILVVEDQQEMRDVVRQTLERHGYDVLEAADGHAALALLESREGPVHLLLTDVVMPHMSGHELVDRVTKHNGSIRVLYTSGYTDDAIGRDGVLDPGIHFIQKPFRQAQLLVRVRDVLDLHDDRDLHGGAASRPS